MNETMDTAVDNIVSPIIGAIKMIFSGIISNPFLRVFFYILITNIVGFVLMKKDKKYAQLNGEIRANAKDDQEYKKKAYKRISESTLIAAAAIGGSLGVLAGMNVFKHKTQKPKFKIGIPVIIGIQAIFIIANIIKVIFFK